MHRAGVSEATMVFHSQLLVQSKAFLAISCQERRKAESLERVQSLLRFNSRKKCTFHRWNIGFKTAATFS